MQISRFEHKYRITKESATAIQQYARFHVDPDEHSRDGDYIVNSLYFDTPWDEDAHETDEGVVLRSKVRLRCYSSTPRPPFFLELKQRFGSSISKIRARLDPADAERMANGLPPTASYRDFGTGNRAALDAIREVIDHREMSPRMWVKYQRTAFLSSWGDGSRLTLDRALETQALEPCAAWQPSSRGWTFPELDERHVLELKFFGAAPGWMQGLANSFSLERTSCSKYGLGIFSLGDSTAISGVVA